MNSDVFFIIIAFFLYCGLTELVLHQFYFVRQCELGKNRIRLMTADRGKRRTRMCQRYARFYNRLAFSDMFRKDYALGIMIAYAIIALGMACFPEMWSTGNVLLLTAIAIPVIPWFFFRNYRFRVRYILAFWALNPNDTTIVRVTI